MGYTVRRPFPRLHLFLHRLPARPTPSRRHPRPPRPSWAGATDSTSAPTRFHLPTPTLTGGIHTNALPSALKALRYGTLPYMRPTPPSADRRVRATAALLPWSGAAAAHRPLYVGRTVDEATSQLAQAAAHPGPACLHAPAQRRTDPALNQVPLAPAEAPASNPESIRQASRHARAGRIQACGLHAALDATAREEVITTSAQDAEKRPMASGDLIDTLPAYCLAHVCGVTETRLQYLGTSRVVAHFLLVCKKRKSYHVQAAASAATRAGRRAPAEAGRKAAQSGETAADKQAAGRRCPLLMLHVKLPERSRTRGLAAVGVEVAAYAWPLRSWRRSRRYGVRAAPSKLK